MNGLEQDICEEIKPAVKGGGTEGLLKACTHRLLQAQQTEPTSSWSCKAPSALSRLQSWKGNAENELQGKVDDLIYSD